MYARRSRLSPRKQMDLLWMFVAGATAWATSELVGVHRNTATSFFMCLRRLIAGKLPSYELSGEVERSFALGEVEIEETLLKQGGKVFTAIVPNARRRPYRQSSREKQHPRALFILTSPKATMLSR
jgi:transposase